MKDTYEKFAFDYDEFGSIESYLGDEKNFSVGCSMNTMSRQS